MRILFKTSLVFLLTIFLFHSGIDAQIFEKLNGPYGGGAKVYEGKTGVLFQILNHPDLYTNVLYKSLNGGSSWTRLPASPATLESDPVEVGLDGNLYCAKSEKLYKSLNDGQSWVSVNSPGNPFIQSFTALPNTNLLLAASDQVYQSSDNGQNWNASPITGIDRFFFNKLTDQVYAISDSKIYLSNDFGLNWTLFYADDFGYDRKEIIVAPNGNLVVSGEEYIWKLNAIGILLNKIDLIFASNSRVDIALSNSGRLFAFEKYKSFYSDNLGDFWIEFGSSGTEKNAYHSFSSTSGGTVFGVKVGGSLFRSIDNGLKWLFSAHGMNYSSVIELEFITDSRIIALTTDGLFFSEDAGSSWTFLIESHDESTIVAGGYSDRVTHIGEEFFYLDYKSIYYFKDWKTLPVVVRKGTGPLGNDKLFVNNKTSSLFTTDVKGIYRSKNKGKNWLALNFTDVLDFYSFPDGSILVTKLNGIYKSVDDGDNWNRVLVFNIGYDSKIIGDTYTTAHIFYYDGSRKILETIDNGSTWAIVQVQGSKAGVIEPLYGVACNNLDYLYVNGASHNEIFWSVDHGKTFNSFSKDVDAVQGLAIAPGQRLYAMTNGNGLYRTKASTSSQKVLIGTVFSDDNKNCIKDPGEVGKNNQIVVGTKGALTQYSYTNRNGDFRMPIDQGDYNLQVSTRNNFWKSCSQTVSTATYNFNDTLKFGLQVLSLCPNLEVDIQSSILRRCVESTLFIDYSNTGSQKALNAYVDVSLDPLFEYVSSSIPFSNQTGSVFRFLLGDIDENVSGFFSIIVKVSCNATMGQIHCAEAHIYPDAPCIPSSHAIIRTSANCLGDSIELIIKNEGNANMTATKNWWVIDQSILSHSIVTFDGGPFYLNAGQTFTKRIASRGRVLFVAEQDDTYPYNKSSQTEIISCTQNPLPGSPPLSINNLDEEEPFISKFCERNRGSFDPNDITGYPQGITNNKFIDNAQQLEYIIRFQNTGTDTAFNIRIENKIPNKELDLSTLTLGASSHPYQFILSPEGKLIFSFSNVLLPDSNINEKASHGFIQYSIKPIDKLSNGTRILNDALIYFDFNAGVNTNVDMHTIGSPIPVKVNEVNKGNDIDFTIEPNPMHELSSILINSKSKNEHYKLSCLDVNSKQMWEMDVKGDHMTISKGELKTGVYFLVLKSENGLQLKTKKFIVE